MARKIAKRPSTFPYYLTYNVFGPRTAITHLKTVNEIRNRLSGVTVGRINPFHESILDSRKNVRLLAVLSLYKFVVELVFGGDTRDGCWASRSSFGNSICDGRFPPPSYRSSYTFGMFVKNSRPGRFNFSSYIRYSVRFSAADILIAIAEHILHREIR